MTILGVENFDAAGVAFAGDLGSSSVEDDGDRPVGIILQAGEHPDQCLPDGGTFRGIVLGEFRPLENHAVAVNDEDFLFHPGSRWEVIWRPEEAGY